MDENKKNNSTSDLNSKDKFRNFIKTPRGKAVLFFGVYFIFFVGLAIFSRAAGTGNSFSPQLNVTPYSYSLKQISNHNYHYQYQYQIDGSIVTFEGDRANKKSLFSDGVTSYYQNGDLFMRNQEGIWIKCDNPYIFPSLLDDSNINKIISSATYVSKTELASGEEEVNFEISTTTLVKILDGIDIDLDDPVNTIQLKKDDTGEVVEIRYNLTNYAIFHGRCSSQFELMLSYSNFDGISKIQDPA